MACKQHPYKQGEAIYEYHCENCHMADGSGLEKLIPPLSSSNLMMDTTGTLVCLIRKGLPFNEETRQQMPANLILNEVELANLLNFLQNKYGLPNQAVKVSDIQRWLAGCQSIEN
ncbi:MAG: cytochrome c [Bacteroidota bacterium]|nr:cytochrome c [Bacteroidota bacterium]